VARTAVADQDPVSLGQLAFRLREPALGEQRRSQVRLGAGREPVPRRQRLATAQQGGPDGLLGLSRLAGIEQHLSEDVLGVRGERMVRPERLARHPERLARQRLRLGRALDQPHLVGVARDGAHVLEVMLTQQIAPTRRDSAAGSLKSGAGRPNDSAPARAP
jgi:hypothetical protein